MAALTRKSTIDAGIENRLPTFASRTAWLPRPSGRIVDSSFRILCQAAAVFIIVAFVCLVGVLLIQSWKAITEIGWRFFVNAIWDPGESHQIFGAAAFVFGTLATSIIAMVIAVPLGVGTAAYLAEIAPRWIRRPGAFLVEMLAAIPSVVYGFWGLFVLAPLLQRFYTMVGGPNSGGVGVLAAGLILSIMIVPYITAVAHDVLRAVPRAQREASLSLGATRWQTIWSVVLPYARPGIIGGCFLALGRALGETMAVTMLIGNRPDMNFSPIPFTLWGHHFTPFALGNSIASVIANEITEATTDLYLSALVELGLVLLLVSVITNALARLLIQRMQRPRVNILRAPVAITPALNGVPVPEVRSTASATGMDHSFGSFLRPNQASGSSATRVINNVMTAVLGACLLTTVLPLFFIVGDLIYRGVDSLSWNFFVNLPAPVGETGGGLANAIYGSLLLVGLAMLGAVPVGVLAAIYLVEYRSDRLGPTVRFIGELLSGVPSIVIGIFAYYLMVRPMGHFSGWAGAFALGIMMVPIVLRASEEALRLVPVSIRSASHALGAGHAQTVLRVVVPAALPAVLTGVFLAIARIGGETAPLLLTASSNQFWPSSPNDFMPSLPVYIFNYAISPYPDWHRIAWAAALVLMGGIMILNIGVRWMTARRAFLASRSE